MCNQLIKIIQNIISSTYVSYILLIFVLEHPVNNEQDNIPNYNPNMFENINSIKKGLCIFIY